MSFITYPRSKYDMSLNDISSRYLPWVSFLYTVPLLHKYNKDWIWSRYPAYKGQWYNKDYKQNWKLAEFLRLVVRPELSETEYRLKKYGQNLVHPRKKYLIMDTCYFVIMEVLYKWSLGASKIFVNIQNIKAMNKPEIRRK